jgi:hypothetical protein
MNLSVNLAPVADLHDWDGRLRVVDIVDDAVITDSNPPGSLPLPQLLASHWAWIFGKRTQFFFNRFGYSRRNGLNLAFERGEG